MNVIVVEKLRKIYNRVPVLNGISITFEAGKVYGIVGRNGSGKSVFLKLLLGILKPTEGTVVWERKDDSGPVIGAVIDGCDLYMDLTGMQNLTYLANFRRLIGKEEIRQALVQVGLEPDNPKKIKKYSLGMRKRLLIAQAIMEKPDILILDEPTNSLDQDGVRMFYEVVEQAKKRGTTIIITSHYKEDIERLCDITYEIKEGKLC